jgi:arylsulfatase A-like enzyme
MVAWPGRVRPQVSTELAELVDLYPTLLDLAAVPPLATQHPLQGTSLAQHLTNSAPIGKKYLVSENWTQSTIITATHKLGVWRKPEQSRHGDYRAFGDMLFDRTADPHELHNCAGNASHHAIEQQLRAWLAEWHARIPANLPDLPSVPRSA